MRALIGQHLPGRLLDQSKSELFHRLRFLRPHLSKDLAGDAFLTHEIDEPLYGSKSAPSWFTDGASSLRRAEKA